MFQADDIRAMLDKASVQLKAMILLAINCGMGNSDCSTLPLSALKLDIGWVDFPRGKTGIERRCPLWPETVAAIRAVVTVRPKAKSAVDDNLVLLTWRGQPWVRFSLVETKEQDGKVKVKAKPDDAIAKEIRKLLDA